MFPRSIWWDDGDVAVLDQTKLPHTVTVAHWRTLDDAANGITTMQVRGAPLIGVAAAYAVALAMREDPTALDHSRAVLTATRPTAVNLTWALDQICGRLGDIEPSRRAAVARTLADELAEADIAACRRIGESGVALVAAVHERTRAPVRVLTHCNAGRLACVQWGTATAPLYLAQRAGIPLQVWVSETRPRNQGAALTAWELGEAGIDHELIVDNAAGHLMASGLVDLVITGADRIAANGDTANKIGTVLKALAARHYGVDFYIAAPRSTFDPRTATGADIAIEERSSDEVTFCGGRRIAPDHTTARNWGFDITPAALITGYLTDEGIIDRSSLVTFIDRS